MSSINFLVEKLELKNQREGQQKILPYLLKVLKHTLVHPLKVATVRLIQQTGNYYYNGLFDCLIKLLRERPLALYSGFVPDMIVMLIESTLRNKAFRLITVPLLGYLPLDLRTFACLPSDLVMGLILYPLLTISTKLKAQIPDVKEDMACDVKSEGTVECAKKIFRKHSILGFYRGFSGDLINSFLKYSTMILVSKSIVSIPFLRDYYEIPHA